MENHFFSVVSFALLFIPHLLTVLSLYLVRRMKILIFLCEDKNRLWKHCSTLTQTQKPKIYYEKDKSIFWPIYFIHRKRAITLDCVVDFGIFFFILPSTKMKLDFRIFLDVLLQSDGFVPFIVHYVIHIKINHFIVIDHQFIIKNVISIVVLVSPFSDELKIEKNKCNSWFEVNRDDLKQFYTNKHASKVFFLN